MTENSRLEDLKQTLNSVAANKSVNSLAVFSVSQILSDWIGTLELATLHLVDYEITSDDDAVYWNFSTDSGAFVFDGKVLIKLETATLTFKPAEAAENFKIKAVLQGKLSTVGGQTVKLKGEFGDDTPYFYRSDEPDFKASLAQLTALASADGKGISAYEKFPFASVLALNELEISSSLNALSGETIMFRSVAANDFQLVENNPLRQIEFFLKAENATLAGIPMVSSAGGFRGIFNCGHECVITLYFSDTGRTFFRVNAKEGDRLPNLEEFAKFIGGDALASLIAGGQKFIGLSDIGIDALGFETDLLKKQLLFGQIKGHSVFCEARFDISLVLPNFKIAANLAAGEKLSLRTVLQNFLGSADGFPDVNVRDFGFSLDSKPFDFKIFTRIEGDLLKFGALSLNNVAFEINKTSDRIIGSARADFAFGEINFGVGADFGGERGWLFSGETAESCAVTLPKLLQNLSSAELDLSQIPLPEEIANASLSDLAVNIGTKTALLKIAGKSHLEISLPWNEKKITFDAQAEFKTFQDAGVEDGKRTFEGFFQGEAATGNAAVTMRLDVGKTKSFHGYIPTGKEIRLSEILGLFLPEAAALPHDLGDISFRELDILIGENRTGHVRGTVEGFWKFPFGQTELRIEKAVFNLERKESGAVICALAIEGRATLADEIIFKKFAFAFNYDGDRNWKIGGEVNALIFSREFDLSAFYEIKDDTKLLKLAYAMPLQGGQPQPLIEIEDVCRLSLREISLSVAAAKNAGATWDFAARGDFALYYFAAPEKQTFAEIKNGALNLSTTDGKTILSFIAEDAALHFPLYRYEIAQNGVTVEKTLEIAAGFKRLEIAREKNKWRFEAASFLKFKDVPAPLDKLFADEITGKLLITEERASLGISRLAKPLEVIFPPLPTATGEIDLGTGAADLQNINLSLGKEDLRLSGELAFGIPSNLNKIFGTDADGEASLRVFRTYAAGGTAQQKADSMLRFELDFGTAGIGGKLVNSPFEGVTIENNALIVDLSQKKDIGTERDLGRIEIDLPELKFDLEQGSFRATGGFRIDKKRGLKLPLAPLRELFKLLKIDALADALPYSLPLTEFNFFDPATHSLRTDELLAFCERAQIEIPADLGDALREFGKVANRLPDRFKDYLNVSIPDSLNFKLDVTPDGGVRFNVQADKDRPLKFLIPNFPMFTGIELRGISFGEAFGGSLFIVDADFRLDMFDLPTLILCLTVPFEDLQDYLPRSTAVHQTLIVEELLLFIIYETVIPIPVPVFYTELGASYTDVLGTEWEAHFNFPRPVFNASEAMSLVAEFVKFFSHLEDQDEQYLINLERLPKKMNVTYTVGPNYIRLPKFFGKKEETNALGETTKVGQIIGFKNGLGSFDTFRVLAVLLNTLKKGSLNYLIKQTPLEKRLGHQSLELFDVFNLDVAWALTTPPEFVEQGHRVLTEKVTKAFADKYPNKKLPPLQGTDELLAMLPAVPTGESGKATRISEDEEGVVVFLRGIMMIGGVLTLDSAFGLVATDTRGFGCGLSLRGDVADIIETKLYGLIKIDRHDPDEHFKLAGHASFKMLGREILLGEFFVSDNEFRIKGKVDLFPADLLPDFPLRIYSGKPRAEVQKPEDTYITGYISRDKFLFEGGMNFELGVIRLAAHLSVRAGTFTDTAGAARQISQIVLKLYLFDATISFVFLRTEEVLLLKGDSTPINFLGGLLQITGESRTGGATAYLEVARDQFRAFYLSGSIALLGIASSSIKIVANPNAFLFNLRHTFNLSGLSSGLNLDCLLIPGDRFETGAQFVLNLDLGQILKDLIYAVTRVSIDLPSLKTGCAVNLKILAEEEVVYAPREIETRERERDEWIENRRRLFEQSERLIANVDALRGETRKKRLAAERQIDDTRREIEEKRRRIEELRTEVGGLEKQIVEAPDEMTREQYREQLAQWKAKIEKLGGDVSQFTEILSKQKRVLQNARNEIGARRAAIQDAAFELESRGETEQLEKLNQQIALLDEEDQKQEARIFELEDVEIAPREDNLTAELEKNQAAAQAILSETAQTARANAAESIGGLEENLNVLLSIFDLENSAPRELKPLGAEEFVEFAAPSPRDSRLAFSFDVKFRFLGLELELFETNFELYGLNRIDWNDYRVLSDLPNIILKELSRNIEALLGKALENFGKIFWHLLRFVFDADFRRWCLADTTTYELPPPATDDQLKHDETVKSKLMESGWDAEEIEILRDK